MLDPRALLRMLQRARAGVEPGRRAHQLVEDRPARWPSAWRRSRCCRRCSRHPRAGTPRWRRRSARPARRSRAAPARRRVIRSYSVATTKPALGRAVAVEEVRRRRGHDPHRIERGVHQLDQLGPLLHHPVGAGEAEVARAQMQHLDDVLRLEDLGLEASSEIVGR